MGEDGAYDGARSSRAPSIRDTRTFRNTIVTLSSFSGFPELTDDSYKSPVALGPETHRSLHYNESRMHGTKSAVVTRENAIRLDMQP